MSADIHMPELKLEMLPPLIAVPVRRRCIEILLEDSLAEAVRAGTPLCELKAYLLSRCVNLITDAVLEANLPPQSHAMEWFNAQYTIKSISETGPLYKPPPAAGHLSHQLAIKAIEMYKS